MQLRFHCVPTYLTVPEVRPPGYVPNVPGGMGENHTHEIGDAFSWRVKLLNRCLQSATGRCQPTYRRVTNE